MGNMFFEMSFFMKCSYFFCLFIGKFCTCMELAPRMISSSFANHVLHIVSLGTFEKMFRIYAQSIITMMANAIFIRLFIFEKKPCSSVGEILTPWIAKPKTAIVSITVPMFSASPVPAPGVAVFRNLCQKAVKNGNHILSFC